MALSYKKKSDWRGYYQKMSNKDLIGSVKEHKRYSGSYRGTVLPAVAREELARRKADGRIKQSAGKPARRRQQNPFGGFFGGF